MIHVHADVSAYTELMQVQKKGREKQQAFDPHTLAVHSAWIERHWQAVGKRLQRLKDLVESDQEV